MLHTLVVHPVHLVVVVVERRKQKKVAVYVIQKRYVVILDEAFVVVVAVVADAAVVDAVEDEDEDVVGEVEGVGVVEVDDVMVVVVLHAGEEDSPAQPSDAYEAAHAI
jgi:hypothetical protein